MSIFYGEMKVLPHKMGESQTLEGVWMPVRMSVVHGNWQLNGEIL